MAEKLKERWTAGSLLRHLAVWLFSSVLSILAGFSFIYGVILAVGLYYDAHHAIPNPVERGDDLGVGLVGILWASIALIVAIPLIDAVDEVHCQNDS